MDVFKEAFQGKYANLVKEIDCESGLWTELRSRNVLTAEQIADCQSLIYVCRY